MDKGWVLAGYFYGYIVLQVIGCSFSERFGTKIVMGSTTMFCSILTIIIPPIVLSDKMWLIFTIPLFHGLAASVTYKCLPPMITQWAPADEHSRFVTISYIGNTFGTMVTYPISGVILDKLGWEALFYLTGGLGVLWFFAWTYFVSDDPATNKFISTKEKEYILTHRNIPTREIEIKRPPYIKILSTPSVWILALCEFASSFGKYIIIIEGPSFIDDVLSKDIFENGLLNTLPLMATFVYGMIISYVSEYLLAREYLKKPTFRQCMAVISLVFPGITLATLGYTTTNGAVCISLLTIGIGFRSAVYEGHLGAVYDIAQTYSGTVSGFISTVGYTSGIITPFAASSFLTVTPYHVTSWRRLFWLSAGIPFVAAFIFLLKTLSS